MSRHRNVRTMNYEDEYAGYDDVYGHSVEDDYCVSPSTAAQFMYNRGEQHSLSAYVAAERIPEEEGESEEEAEHLNDSGSLTRPRLSSMDEAKLNSCLEEMRNVLGDATTEQVMVDAVMKYNYNLEKALDYLLTQQKDAPKPQRKPRQNRRSRSDEDDNDMTPSGSPQTDLSSQSDFFPPFCPELPTDDLNPPTVSVPGPGLISPALLTGLLTTSDFTATQIKLPPGYSDINKPDPANPSMFSASSNLSHIVSESRLPRPPPGFAQLPTNIATKTDVNKNLQSFIASFSGDLSSASPKDVSPSPFHDTSSNPAFNQNLDQIKTGITVSGLCTDTGTTKSNTWEQSDCSVQKEDSGAISETTEKHEGPGGHRHTDLSSLAASIQKDSSAANTQKHDVARLGLLQSGPSSLLQTGSSMPDTSGACGSPAAGLSEIDSATGTGLNLADLAKEQQRTNRIIQTEVKTEEKKVPSLSLSELAQQQQSSAKPAGQASKAIDVPGSKPGLGLATLAAQQQSSKAAAETGSHQVVSPGTKPPSFSLAALAAQHQAASDKKQGSVSGSPVIIGSPSVTSAATTEKKGAGFSLAALAAQHRSASSSPLSSVSGSPVILGSPGMSSLSALKGGPLAGFEHHAAPRSTQSSVSGSPHTIGSPTSVAGERTNPGLSLSALIAQQKTTQGTRSSTSSESQSYSGSPSLAELAIGHQRTVTGGQVSIYKGNKDQRTGQPTVVGSPMSGNSSGLSLAALAFQHSSAQGPKGSAGLQGASSPVSARPGAGSDAAGVITATKRNKNKQKSKPATHAQKALKTEKGAAPKISSIIPEPTMHVSGELKAKPSAFASAICCNVSNDTARDKIKRIKSKFSYTRQKSATISAPMTLHPIKPFDFSSPSPDDIVRHKQKAAFGSRKSNQINEKPPEISKAQPQKSEPQMVKAANANSEFKTGSDGIAKMTFASAKPAQTGFTPVPEANNSKVVKVEKPKTTERSETEVDAAAGAVAMETDLKPAPQKEQVATPVATKSSSKSKVDKAAARRAYAERKAEGGKDLINLVVVGHVDAGKSTLMGHLLFQLGFVNKRMMHKYEQESKKIGKASFAYAWVLDETEEERARGVTMDIAQTHFETPTKSVTLLDAPGHKDFIPNMITGAAQADVAILVINATRGEFETGFDSGGQTREHAMLIRSLGVSQLLVAINKMDTVEWSKERFEEITKKLSTFLKQAGFKENDVMFVPCSGLSGQNLTKPPEEPRLAAWYKGQTMADSIDKFRPPERPIDKPLRLCVADVFKGSSSGVAMAGTVQAGTVQVGEKVLIMPQAEQAVIKSILIDEGPSQFAFAGDAVTITLTGIEQTDVGIGSIICDNSSPIRSAQRVRARVVVFSIDVPLTKGFPVVFHYQTLSEPAHIKRLVSQLHKSTGEVIRRKPRCLTKNMNAVIEVELERPVCIELYKDYKDLGRFMLRYGGKTIAAGLVTEILEKKSSRAD